MKIKPSNGFTLVEAALSVALLLLIWLAAIDSFILAKYSASYAKHKIQATYIAQQEMERLRKYDYNTMGTQAGIFNDVHLDTKGTPNNAADDLMATRVISIDPSLSNYRNVRVEIRWNELLFGTSRTMHEYCATIIANETQVN